MQGKRVFNAFFSYSHLDAKATARHVEPLAEELENIVTARLLNARLAVWRDNTHLLTGRRWDAEIEERLRASDILIVLFSPSWIGSDYCRKEYTIFEEVETGYGGGEYVVPILVRSLGGQEEHLDDDQRAIYERLRKRQFFPKLEVGGRNRQRAIEEVAGHIADILNRRRNAAIAAQVSADENAPLAKPHQILDNVGETGAVPNAAVMEAQPRTSTPGQTRKMNAYFRMKDSLVFFDDRFGRTFPGKRDLYEVTDARLACKYLLTLLRNPLTASHGERYVHPIWWWRGHRNMPIEKIKTIGETTLLMDVYELDIKRIVVFPGWYYKYHFVYVEINPMSPTGLYEDDDDSIRRSVDMLGYCGEEYAIFRDKLFTRAEYDDNGAEVNGRYINFRGKANLRYRYLSAHNFLIAAHNSPINNSKADQGFEDLLNLILKGEEDVSTLADHVRRLPVRESR